VNTASRRDRTSRPRRLTLSINVGAKRRPLRIVGIVNGQRSITADTALRLSHYFGMSAQFWMNAQSRICILRVT
jgi:addiction module HigA family antidote